MFFVLHPEFEIHQVRTRKSPGTIQFFLVSRVFLKAGRLWFVIECFVVVQLLAILVLKRTAEAFLRTQLTAFGLQHEWMLQNFIG